MHCISNPFPKYTIKKGHPTSTSYCQEELIRDSINLRTKYGGIHERQPLDIRKCDVLGYSNQRKKQDYRSQIFFEAPEFRVQEQKKLLKRPMSGRLPQNGVQYKPKSQSTQSQIGSISYQDNQLLDPPVRITIKLKSQHTNKSQLLKFQDKLTIKQLENNMVEVSGLVPLKAAKLFKTIFKGSQFHIQRVTY